MKHIKKKDILSETKPDSIAKNLGIVVTDNKPKIIVSNDVQSDTVDVMRTINGNGSHDVNCNFTSDRDIVTETFDIGRILNNEDILSTDRLASTSTHVVSSNSSDMENEVKDIYDNKATYEYI